MHGVPLKWQINILEKVAGLFALKLGISMSTDGKVKNKIERARTEVSGILLFRIYDCAYDKIEEEIARRTLLRFIDFRKAILNEFRNNFMNI